MNVEAPVVRSISHSPVRNNEILQEIAERRHELSKQQCEQHHHISSLKYKLDKEAKEALHATNAEKYHLDYEIRNLEERIAAKARLTCGEEERMITRRKCYDQEIIALNRNLEHNEDLIQACKEKMTCELKTREIDFHKAMNVIRDDYGSRLADMKANHARMVDHERNEIAKREEELDLLTHKIIPEEQRRGEESLAFIRSKTSQLRAELQRLNDLFKISVDKTKRQNDKNQKIYDQNAEMNKLKIKIQKKMINTKKQSETFKDVINKLEKFGYGYQKTFKRKTQGNLKRQVTTKKGKKRSRSLIRAKENIGIDYAIEDHRRHRDSSTNAESSPKRGRRTAIKRYRSYTRSLNRGKGSGLGVGSTHKVFKTKANNFNEVLIRARDLTGENRHKPKKKLKRRN
ncbi:unnamed protein product [Moneuplotes crassus]|uniref:Uncharacterized protein n=1 Tax=Euplotes crassus TaxID=5936 RepID=A0AAD1UPW8_EUPCR|nr:unnamed protein product [Moneuplotes crassus]